jgi:hypothetical protein
MKFQKQLTIAHTSEGPKTITVLEAVGTGLSLCRRDYSELNGYLPFLRSTGTILQRFGSFDAPTLVIGRYWLEEISHLPIDWTKSGDEIKEQVQAKFLFNSTELRDAMMDAYDTACRRAREDEAKVLVEA